MGELGVSAFFTLSAPQLIVGTIKFLSLPSYKNQKHYNSIIIKNPTLVQIINMIVTCRDLYAAASYEKPTDYRNPQYI